MNEYKIDQGPTYGERVRAGYEAKGMQQKDLAAALGLSPQYLNDVVFGRRVPRQEVAEKIAEIVGVRLESPREKELRDLCIRLLNENQTLKHTVTYVRARLKQDGQMDEFYDEWFARAFRETMGPKERADTLRSLGVDPYAEKE